MRIISENEFTSETTTGAVVVDFYASWCSPCRVLMPMLEDLEKEYKKVKFIKMDAETCKDLCVSLNIRGVPTVLLFKDGAESERLVGLAEKDKYKAAIDKLV